MELESSNPFDKLYLSRTRLWLGVILLAYLVVAVRFAMLTPPWQAPDEPAHYNYIKSIATTGALPILQMGDYNQRHQEALLSSKFSPELSVDGVRYENYQPPLYYGIAAIIYHFSNGSLLLLRLFGVLVGVGIVLLFYRCMETIFADKPLMSVGATAFAALLPMHVAVTAAVNNDGLAELLSLASLALLLQWIRRHFDQEIAPSTSIQERRFLLRLGLLFGLGLLTKAYAYLLLPLAVFAIVVTIWRQDRSWRKLGQGIGVAVWMVAPALLLGLPWWIRNIRLYGGWDFLGLNWHDQVVIGQPRTNEWLATYGLMGYSERAFNFTFKSFWGVFGWMGVFMDERIYFALLIFTGVLFLGVLWALVRFISGAPDNDATPLQLWILGFFALVLVGATASYIWYNSKFVQHQGRYFFWGLLPISAFVALGWREALRPLQGAVTGFLAGVLAAALTVTGYLGGDLDKWSVLIISLTAIFLLLQPLLLIGTTQHRIKWMPQRWQSWTARPFPQRLLSILRFAAWGAPFFLLFVLDLLIPTLFLIPQLVR